MEEFMNPMSASKQLSPSELLAFGQPEVAEQRLQNILQKQHDNLEAQVELIRLYLYLGEFDRAQQEIIQARNRWPAEKRLAGLLRCAERGENKHQRKIRSCRDVTASRFFTGEKFFNLLQFLFSIIFAAGAFALFYYYVYYLDGSNNSRAGLSRVVNMPVNILILQAVFYFVLILILYHGFKNLIYFLFQPHLVAVSPQGLVIKAKCSSLRLTWDQIQSITLVEDSQYHKKENFFTYDYCLDIRPVENRIVWGVKRFLLNIPRSGIGKFRALVTAVREYFPVKEEKRRNGQEQVNHTV